MVNRKLRRVQKATRNLCLSKDGDDLFDHYRYTLENLGNEKGLLGLIFAKSQNRFQYPAKLRRSPA